MRNRHHIAVSVGVSALFTQCLPQFGKVVTSRFIGRYGRDRHFCITKNDVSVHVFSVGRIGIFIADEGSKLAIL